MKYLHVPYTTELIKVIVKLYCVCVCVSLPHIRYINPLIIKKIIVKKIDL